MSLKSQIANKGQLVSRYINTAYDIVKVVADNIKDVNTVADCINTLGCNVSYTREESDALFTSQAYVTAAVEAAAGLWSENLANIYFNTGNVGIGTNSFANPLGLLHLQDGVSGASINALANDFIIESDTDVGFTLAGGFNNTANIYFADSGSSAVSWYTYDFNDNHLEIGIAGSKVFTVLANLNVGILTAAPGYPLDVNGAIQSTDLRQAGTFYNTVADGENYIVRRAAGTEMFRLNDDNAFGLGAVPNANVSSGAQWFALGPNVNISANKFEDGSGWYDLYHNCYYNGTNNVYVNNGPAMLFELYNGNFYWGTAPSGTAGNTPTFTTRMFLTNAGRLAIGNKQNPDTLVHLYSSDLTPLTAECTDAGTSRGPIISLYRNSPSSANDDSLGTVDFYGNNNSASKIHYAGIRAKVFSNGTGSEQGSLILGVKPFNTTVQDYLTLTGHSATFLSSTSNSFEGPVIYLTRDRTTPANDDAIGAMYFRGDDSIGNVTNYSYLFSEIVNVASGAEQGRLTIGTILAGTQTSIAYFETGLIVGTPIGLDKGAGSGNFESLFIDGVAVGTGGTTVYPTTAINLDGSTNSYFLSSPTGAADGTKGIFSIFLQINSSAISKRIFTSTSDYVDIKFNSLGELSFTLWETAGNTDLIQLTSTTRFTANATRWLHILASWDTTTGLGGLWVNDQKEEAFGDYIASNSANVDYTGNAYLARSTVGTERLNGSLSDFYFNQTEFLDFTNIANRRLFVNENGTPMDQGITGANATGTQPIFYLKGISTTYHNNLGSGGAFTVDGTITNSSDTPSTPSYNNRREDYVFVNTTGAPVAVSAYAISAIAIGENITITDDDVIAIGQNITSTNAGVILIGDTASGAQRTIAIGQNAAATGDASIVIGQDASGSGVAIGHNAVGGGVSIGLNATSGGVGISIGTGSSGGALQGSNNIAIGTSAKVDTVSVDNATAIGNLVVNTIANSARIGSFPGATNDSIIHTKEKGRLYLEGDQAAYIHPNYITASLPVGVLGATVYDSTTDQLKVYTGASWDALSVGGGTTGINDNADAVAMTITAAEDIGFGETVPEVHYHFKQGDVGALNANVTTGYTTLIEDTTSGMGLAIVGPDAGAAKLYIGARDFGGYEFIVNDSLGELRINKAGGRYMMADSGGVTWFETLAWQKDEKSLGDSTQTLLATDIFVKSLFTIAASVARTLTTPTATLIGDQIVGLSTNSSFTFTIVNTGASTATLAAGTGVTLAGDMVVAANSSGTFVVLCTSTTATKIFRS